MNYLIHIKNLNEKKKRERESERNKMNYIILYIEGKNLIARLFLLSKKK
jgi:hypothetical protein